MYFFFFLISYNFKVYFRSDGTHELEDDHIFLSNDPEESKWDYFREDSLLHVFHTLLHKVWEGGKMSNQLPGRIHELFFYAHQQLLRRYVDFCKRIISYEDLFFRAKIERKILGLEDIVSLTPEELKKPLGPGYKAGK